jgi:hypothetical protein
MDGHSKNYDHEMYLVPMFVHCVFIVESTKKQRESKKQRKEHEKMKRERERKIKDNLILSHVYFIFLLIEPSNWRLCLYTHSLYLTIKNKIKCDEGPICSNSL